MNTLKLYWSHFSESGQDNLIAVGLLPTQAILDDLEPVMEFDALSHKMKNAFEEPIPITNIQY